MIPNNKQFRAKTGLLRAEGLNNFGRQVRWPKEHFCEIILKSV